MIDKENNFDFLRLLFAVLVIVSHSFPLTNTKDNELLLVLTNNQADFGSFAVKCFFIISGYLIFISLSRSKNLMQYLWKRLIRIFPALIVALIITLSFLPFIYHGEGSIFNKNDYWSYFYRNLGLYKIQYNIDGIFESNPFPKAINGSLWTIRYEFTMYLFLMVFFYFKRKLSQILLLATFIISFILSLFFPDFLNAKVISKFFLYSGELYEYGCYFIAGSFLACIHFENFKQKKYLLIICPIVLIGATVIGQFHSFAYFLLPPIILGFGLLKTPYIKSIGKTIGDISYGVYIYGFLVQQTLMYFFNLRTYPLMLLSILITMCISYLSWHIIEKRALRLKPTYSNR